MQDANRGNGGRGGLGMGLFHPLNFLCKPEVVLNNKIYFFFKKKETTLKANGQKNNIIYGK